MPNHPYDRRDQVEVAARADHPAEPEPRRHGHRHPEPPAHRLDVQLVGLDVPQVNLPAQDQLLVKALTMTARPIPSGGDRPLIEPEGDDDGLHRTVVAEQSNHDGHQVDGFLEAVERRVARGGESLAAGEASVTALLPAMHVDVAESELSAYGAIGVVAELSERVHRASLRARFGDHARRDARWTRVFQEVTPLITVQWGATQTRFKAKIDWFPYLVIA